MIPVLFVLIIVLLLILAASSFWAAYLAVPLLQGPADVAMSAASTIALVTSISIIVLLAILSEIASDDDEAT